MLNLPVEKLGEVFDVTMGRPTKELHQMMGVAILQQLHDLTDAETQGALCYDLRWHYALDITSPTDQNSYICQRTIWEYRHLIVEKNLAEEVFALCTDNLLKVFGTATDKQRLDSTHIKSNMRKLGRVRLFGETIRVFLRALKRKHADRHAVLDKVLCARYDKKNKDGCFGHVRPSESGVVLEQAGQDLAMLVALFHADSAVSMMTQYQMLVRVLDEQCAITQDEDAGQPRTEVKAPKEVPSDSLQNPSDPDASYSGHKGQGYAVQLMETYTTTDDETALNLITHVVVTPAHISDSLALIPALEDTASRGCQPRELVADTIYGGDANQQAALALGVTLVAPTAGCDDTQNGGLGLKDFTCDEKTLTITACPRGQAAVETQNTGTGRKICVFDHKICAACSDCKLCPVNVTATRACVYYNDRQIRLALRRQYEATDAFRDRYRWRAGIEGTNSRLKSQTCAGHLRVRGLARVRLAILFKALGLNILRATRAYMARKRRLGAISVILQPAQMIFSLIKQIMNDVNQFSQIASQNRPLIWNIAT